MELETKEEFSFPSYLLIYCLLIGWLPHSYQFGPMETYMVLWFVIHCFHYLTCCSNSSTLGFLELLHGSSYGLLTHIFHHSQSFFAFLVLSLTVSHLNFTSGETFKILPIFLLSCSFFLLTSENSFHNETILYNVISEMFCSWSFRFWFSYIFALSLFLK